MMALIHFREARPDELGQIAELTALAFEDYPLFVVARKGRRNARGVDEAMFALQRAETRLYLKYQVCLVGTIDDEIVAAALMDNPHKKKTTRWQYLRCGGMTLATKVGIGRLRTFLALAGKTTQAIDKNFPNSWYLDTLAVDPARQGQRLGSRMINEGIIPFIAQSGGGTLTLTTNTELNAEFYRKNGFTLADETRIARNDVSMKNWTFVKTVPELCPVIPPSSTNTTESYPVIPA